jgi:hypothetical protein
MTVVTTVTAMTAVTWHELQHVRLRAGSDADVTDVSTMTVVTTVTAMTAVTWHELQHVTWDSFYRSPQKGPKRIIKHHS